MLNIPPSKSGSPLWMAVFANCTMVALMKWALGSQLIPQEQSNDTAVNLSGGFWVDVGAHYPAGTVISVVLWSSVSLHARTFIST